MRKFLVVLAVAVLVAGCSAKDADDANRLTLYADAVTAADLSPAGALFAGIATVAEISHYQKERKTIVYKVDNDQRPNEWAQICLDRADKADSLDESTMALADLTCSRARTKSPRNMDLAKAHGTILLRLDPARACQAFSAVMVMGDSSEFLQHCNADGSPK